jgi:hypothetical protein
MRSFTDREDALAICWNFSPADRTRAWPAAGNVEAVNSQGLTPKCRSARFDCRSLRADSSACGQLGTFMIRRWDNMTTKTNQQTILSEVEASQGIKLGHMRYVLGVSLALSVVAGLALWSFYSV